MMTPQRPHQFPLAHPAPHRAPPVAPARRTRWLALAGTSLWLGLAPLQAAFALDLDDVVTGDTVRFLPTRPDPGAYWYESRVRITPDSLQSGLVELQTCHRALDPNHHIVVAFHAERVKRIAVASAQGVGSAEVVGHRVELRDVRRGAFVCIDLSSRALEPQGEGQWRLYAGPLMRRYLDGYLPMQAKLNFEWPSGLLMLNATEPAAQPGVSVSQSDTGAQMDITFAGRMRATLDLRRPGSPPALQSKANPEVTSLNVGVPVRLE